MPYRYKTIPANLICGNVVDAFRASGDVCEDHERHLLHFWTTFESKK